MSVGCLPSIVFGLNVPNSNLSLSWQFIKVIYYQFKFGLEENKKDIDVQRKSASLLFDESWLSADSFMHHLCKVLMIYWTNVL